MKLHIQNRCTRIARYVIQNRCTVRQAATKFDVSKTTVHIDITNRLAEIDQGLYDEVRKVLDTNRKERHLRGGEATKRRYAALKQ